MECPTSTQLEESSLIKEQSASTSTNTTPSDPVLIFSVLTCVPAHDAPQNSSIESSSKELQLNEGQMASLSEHREEEIPFADQASSVPNDVSVPLSNPNDSPAPLGASSADFDTKDSHVPLGVTSADKISKDSSAPLDSSSGDFNTRDSFAPLEASSADFNPKDSTSPLDNSSADLDKQQSSAPREASSAGLNHKHSSAPLDASSADTNVRDSSTILVASSADLSLKDSSVSSSVISLIRESLDPSSTASQPLNSSVSSSDTICPGTSPKANARLTGHCITGHKKCEYGNGCTIQPSFNYPGEMGGMFCGCHRLEGMVNVVNKMCEFEGCHKRPSLNYPGVRPAIRCGEHKLPGMTNSFRKLDTNVLSGDLKEKAEELKKRPKKRGDMIKVQRHFIKEKIFSAVINDELSREVQSEANPSTSPASTVQVAPQSSAAVSTNLQENSSDGPAQSSMPNLANLSNAANLAFGAPLQTSNLPIQSSSTPNQAGNVPFQNSTCAVSGTNRLFSQDFAAAYVANMSMLGGEFQRMKNLRFVGSTDYLSSYFPGMHQVPFNQMGQFNQFNTAPQPCVQEGRPSLYSNPIPPVMGYMPPPNVFKEGYMGYMQPPNVFKEGYMGYMPPQNVSKEGYMGYMPSPNVSKEGYMGYMPPPNVSKEGADDVDLSIFASIASSMSHEHPKSSLFKRQKLEDGTKGKIAELLSRTSEEKSGGAFANVAGRSFRPIVGRATPMTFPKC